MVVGGSIGVAEECIRGDEVSVGATVGCCGGLATGTAAGAAVAFQGIGVHGRQYHQTQ